MKRFVASFSALAVVGGGLSAPALAAAPIKLICACGDTSTPIKQELAEFMKANPGIEVTETDQPTAAGKMAVYAAAGGGPDVIWIDNQKAVDWGGQGFLLDLSSYIKRDKSQLATDDFFPGSLANLTVDGAVYGLPSWMASSGLYYNKTLFDASGVDYPSDTWSWNNLLANGKKLAKTSAGGAMTQWAFTSDGWQLNWSTGPTIWVWSNGGRLLSADGSRFELGSSAAMQALRTYDDVIFKEGFSYTPSDQQHQYLWDAFSAGKIAIWDSPSWNNKTVAESAAQNGFKWGVAPTMLSPYTHKRAAFDYVRGFAVTANSAHKDAAWKLVEFLTSKKLEQERALIGTQPARRSAASDWLKFSSNGQPVDLQPLIDAVTVGRYIPSLKKPQANSDFWKAIMDNWNQVLAGKVSVQGFVDTVTPVVNHILQTENH